MEIRDFKNEDWPEAARIYQAGIDTGIATFEVNVPSFEAWDDAHLRCCRKVCEEDGCVRGWAALSPTSHRSCYAGVAEVSVYVAPESGSRGVGQLLLEALIEEAREEGFWTLQSTIFSANAASIRLHEKCGFRVVGMRERIARDAHGVWRDTILMERRI